MKTLIRELLVAFPDWHVTVEDMFGQDKGGDALELARDAPCSLSRHPGDRAQDSRRRNSYRSYRRREDRQTLGLQQLHRRLQRAQGSRRAIARMPALVESLAPIASHSSARARYSSALGSIVINAVLQRQVPGIGRTAAAWPVAARGEEAPLAAIGVSL